MEYSAFTESSNQNTKNEPYCNPYLKYRGFHRGKWEFNLNRVDTKVMEVCRLDYITTAEQRKQWEGSEAIVECYRTYQHKQFTKGKPKECDQNFL